MWGHSLTIMSVGKENKEKLFSSSQNIRKIGYPMKKKLGRLKTEKMIFFSFTQHKIQLSKSDPQDATKLTDFKKMLVQFMEVMGNQWLVSLMAV